MKEKIVYVVFDEYNADELVSINNTMAGARDFAMTFLENIYREDDWKEIAIKEGFENVNELKEAVKSCSDYDTSLGIRIERWTLND